MKTTILFLSLCAFASAATDTQREPAKNPPTQSPLGAISLTASNWQDFGDQNGTNPPGPKISDVKGALSVTFPEVTEAQLATCVPAVDCNSLNYLYTPVARNLTGGSCNFQGAIVNAYCLTITFQIVTTGAPVFNYNLNPDNGCTPTTSGCYPPALRLLLQHKNDNWTNEYYRWYSEWIDNTSWQAPVGSVPLAQGVFTLEVPLNSDWFSDVYGNRSQSELNATLSNLGNIGVVFGGGDYYSHGVDTLNGTATILITNLSVTP